MTDFDFGASFQAERMASASAWRRVSGSPIAGQGRAEGFAPGPQRLRRFRRRLRPLPPRGAPARPGACRGRGRRPRPWPAGRSRRRSAARARDRQAGEGQGRDRPPAPRKPGRAAASSMRRSASRRSSSLARRAKRSSTRSAPAGHGGWRSRLDPHCRPSARASPPAAPRAAARRRRSRRRLCADAAAAARAGGLRRRGPRRARASRAASSEPVGFRLGRARRGYRGGQGRCGRGASCSPNSAADSEAQIPSRSPRRAAMSSGVGTAPPAARSSSVACRRAHSVVAPSSAWLASRNAVSSAARLASPRR